MNVRILSCLHFVFPALLQSQHLLSGYDTSDKQRTEPLTQSTHTHKHSNFPPLPSFAPLLLSLTHPALPQARRSTRMTLAEDVVSDASVGYSNAGSTFLFVIPPQSSPPHSRRWAVMMSCVCRECEQLRSTGGSNVAVILTWGQK